MKRMLLPTAGIIALCITTGGCSSSAPQEPTVDEKADALERRLEGLDAEFERLETKLDRLIEVLEDQQSSDEDDQ